MGRRVYKLSKGCLVHNQDPSLEDPRVDADAYCKDFCRLLSGVPWSRLAWAE